MRIFGVSLVAAVVCGLVSTQTRADDWTGWRGPDQNGVSRESGLVDKWSLEGENVLWKSDIGGRSTPVVMNGKVYLNCRTEHSVTDPAEKIHAREQIVCWDAESGKELWKDTFNVYQTDIPGPRVGWANMVGDPATDKVYLHSVSGEFRCYDSTGKLQWKHALAEEFGKISGYGGRTHTPIIDEDLVIVSYLATNWGDMKGPAPLHYYYAFDKASGELAWIAAPGGAPLDTTYSCPVVKIVHGQRMMIAGNADGGVYGMHARTGKKLWGHVMSRRGINVSPIVVDDLVYISHGEDNIDSLEFGRIECLKILPPNAASEMTVESVWRVNGVKAGYSSPIVVDGVMYVVADTGSLYALDAKTGEQLWQHSLGTVGKGAPLYADGKIYVMEVDGNIHILKPTRKKCETLSHVELQARIGSGLDEIYATPAVANGRVYLVTRDRTICIGEKQWTGKTAPPAAAKPEELPAGTEVDMWQLRPYEVALQKGESAEYELHAFDKNGRFIKKMPATVTAGEGLPGLTAAGNKISTDGVTQPLAGMISATVDGKTVMARVRVFPPLPWKYDFEDLKGLAVPNTWMRAHIKMKPLKLDGVKPVGTDGAAEGGDLNVAMGLAPGKGRGGHTVYIGDARMKDYTIQADVLMLEKKRKLPSIGLTNQRYTFFVKGNAGKLSLQTWQAHLRLGKEQRFNARPDTWYTMKMKVTVTEGVAKIQGKVWPRDTAEPGEWTIETEDPHANEEGSPGLAVYLLSNCYFDNVIVSKE